MNKKKVVSIEDRIPKLKQARKKKATRRLIFYLSVFFLLISVVIYLQSPLSQIKSININGNTIIAKEEIIELSNLTTGANIWTINKNNVKKRIQDNPIIQSASVKRSLPWDVDVTIKEYDLVGFIQEKDYYLPVIEKGEIINNRKSESIRGDAPLLINFSEDKYLKNMAKELQVLKPSILSMISEIYWQPTKENKNKILLYMNDGYVVSSTIRGFSQKMTVYPSIVSQLDEDSEGIIHISGGAYFESFDKDVSESDNNND